MLKDLLTKDRLQKVKSCKDWMNAIEIASKPLIQDGLIEEQYVRSMIESVIQHGPYIVLDDYFALPHASTEKGVHKLCMSLLYVEEEVDLLGKPVKLFVVLATPDNMVHLQALSTLAEMLNQGENMNIMLSGDLNKIYEVIQQY